MTATPVYEASRLKRARATQAEMEERRLPMGICRHASQSASQLRIENGDTTSLVSLMLSRPTSFAIWLRTISTCTYLKTSWKR